MNSVVDLLNLLPLSSLSDDWVKGVWESDFSDPGSVNEVYLDSNNSELADTLDSLIQNLKTLATDDVDEGLWALLVENDISVKALVAFVSHILLTGHQKDADASQRELGILASRTYINLMLVPGSRAFNIFHPELYEKTVDFLKQFISLGCSGNTKRKRNETPVKASQAKRNSKLRRKKKSDDISAENSEELGLSQDVTDELEDEVVELVPQEINKLRKCLHILMEDILVFLEKFSLRQSSSSSHHSVHTLANLTCHEPDSFDGNFESDTPVCRQSVPALAFTCLKILCSQFHGHVGSLMNATCKSLLPNLLMLIGNKAVQNITKQLQTRRDHAVNFVRLLMKQSEERGIVSVRTLLQHMCTKVTDRSEYRSKVAQSVVVLANEMPAESYCKMVQWFYKLSKHNKINNRGFALQIVSELLSLPEKEITEQIAVDLRPYVSHRSLLGILLDRCSDKAPMVRARAIGCFAQCLSSQDEQVASMVKDIMTPQLPVGRPIPRLIRTPGPNNAVTSNEQSADSTSLRSEVTIAQQTGVEGSATVQEEGGARDKDTPLHRIHLTPGFDPNLSDSEGVFSMLRRRTRDEKVNVRKVALQAVEAALRFEMPNYTKQNIEVLRDHCRDPGLSARKQALQSLTDLMMDTPNDDTIQSNWLQGALPLVIDRETSLSEKCMELLEELILSNIVLSVRSVSESHRLAWSLLAIIARPESVDQRRYLRKACHHWSRQGKIKPSLISALESHIGRDNDKAAWMLLAEIAPAAPKINHSFLLSYWQKQKDHESCIETMSRVLTVMKCVAKHIPSGDRETLITDLKARLLKFNTPPELVPVTVSTLGKLCRVQSSNTGDKSLATTWSSDLLMASDKYLSQVVLEHDGKPIDDEDTVVCHLFMLGEIVQLCPGKVPKRVFLLIQSMIAAPCITALPASQSHPTAQNGGSQPQPTIQNDSHNSSGEADLQSNSQLSQGSQGSQGSQPLTQFRGSVMSDRVRAFAFITLGKLCLQNEDLAKKCIAALARELEISNDPAIRNNVMIIMCDLCVRYTTTANHYITNIASCLKDPSALVRKQTLTLITRLLQEDFLKWKGALFYRFISSLLDDNEDIQEFGEFCLLRMLIQRHPNMFFQHFMECLFHFNDYREHSVYNRFAQSEKDRELFSLKGVKNAHKRSKLYLFLLENMSDDHRFQLQSKLVQEVLGGIVDGILPINADTSDILKDALSILSSKEIKLSSLKVRPADDVVDDEQEMAAAVVATAKKTIITLVLKKNVIENIVPVVISLKHTMEKQRSPLLKDLLMYLQELMKDYKTEVNEVLSSDRQLASEIEFDLRKFEEQQQQEAAPQRPTNAAPSVQNTPPQGISSRPHDGTPHTGPSAQRAPRTPALKSKVASPRYSTGKGTPPVMRITPSRAPLSTVAMLNSARRMIHQPTTSGVPTDRLDNIAEGLVDSTGTTPRQTRPAYKDKYRAISTPSVAMGNITFHGDANMTCMPPSPIAEGESEQRLFDDDTTVLGEDLSDKENVLILKSPFIGATKPKVWNITSPAPKKNIDVGSDDNRLAADSDGEQDDGYNGALDKEVHQKGRKRSQNLRKSTRHINQPAEDIVNEETVNKQGRRPKRKLKT